MGFNIKPLSELRLQDKKTYFLDANVWIYFLRGDFMRSNKFSFESLRPHEKEYVDLVDRILVHDSATIGISALLISEIINAFLYKVAMRADLAKRKMSDEEIVKASFKHVYRDDPDSNYKEMLRYLTSQLDSFIELNKLVFREMKFDDIETAAYLIRTFTTTPKVDFNDYCYYELCSDNEWPMVTHDRDMALPDIEIYTSNKYLYDPKP